MSTLTHSLGDKLMEVVGTPQPKSKRNPRSGIDLPDTPTDLAETQNALDSGHKNDEEVGTASQNNDNQNNRTETHMTTTNIETNNDKSLNNGKRSEGTNDFDSRALNVAESATRSLEKVAHEGITIKPAFKKRDALGSAVLGGVIGGVVGGAAAATAMALVPAQRSNDDILNAGGAGFSAGMMVGAGIGYFVGTREPKAEEKSDKK